MLVLEKSSDRSARGTVHVTAATLPRTLLKCPCAGDVLAQYACVRACVCVCVKDEVVEEETNGKIS